jgi:hypothetical protein
MKAYDINVIKSWFNDLEAEITRLEIHYGSKMLNIDESGVRVGCQTSKKVIVPRGVITLYTATQRTRK